MCKGHAVTTLNSCLICSLPGHSVRKYLYVSCKQAGEQHQTDHLWESGCYPKSVWMCVHPWHLWWQVVVQHVNVQGLGRTKEDLLGYEISDVFHAKNLIDVRSFDGGVVIALWLLSFMNSREDMFLFLKCKAQLLSRLQVMKKSHIARQRLLRLGIFKEVEVLIDTSEGNSFTPSLQRNKRHPRMLSERVGHILFGLAVILSFGVVNPAVCFCPSPPRQEALTLSYSPCFVAATFFCWVKSIHMYYILSDTLQEHNVLHWFSLLVLVSECTRLMHLPQTYILFYSVLLKAMSIRVK